MVLTSGNELLERHNIIMLNFNKPSSLGQSYEATEAADTNVSGGGGGFWFKPREIRHVKHLVLINSLDLL